MNVRQIVIIVYEKSSPMILSGQLCWISYFFFEGFYEEKVSLSFNGILSAGMKVSLSSMNIFLSFFFGRLHFWKLFGRVVYFFGRSFILNREKLWEFIQTWTFLVGKILSGYRIIHQNSFEFWRFKLWQEHCKLSIKVVLKIRWIFKVSKNYRNDSKPSKIVLNESNFKLISSKINISPPDPNQLLLPIKFDCWNPKTRRQDKTIHSSNWKHNQISICIYPISPIVCHHFLCEKFPSKKKLFHLLN